MEEFLEALVLTRVEKSILSRRRDHKGGNVNLLIIFRDLSWLMKTIS
jgi:hypothetical protein